MVFAVVFCSLLALLVAFGIVYLTCHQRRVEREEAIEVRRGGKVKELNDVGLLREKSLLKGDYEKSTWSAQQKQEQRDMSMHRMRMDTSIGYGEPEEESGGLIGRGARVVEMGGREMQTIR